MNNERLYGDFTDRDFKRLSAFIYQHFGINLYPAKKVLVKSRIHRRLTALGMHSYEEYCDYVLNEDSDGQEVMEMIDRITTNKTEFFRESDHFDFLTTTYLPTFFKSSGRRNLNIWCAGCSSGEEPYTLAMVLSEFQSKNPGFSFGIVASDISTSMLKTASRAVYDMKLLQQIPAMYRTKYVLKNKNPEKKLIRMMPSIRNKVKFLRHNLLEGRLSVGTNFDVVFCRNTLIYFDRKTQESVIGMLFQHLSPEGYLFLGHSESLVNMNFKTRHIASAIYQKSNN